MTELSEADRQRWDEEERRGGEYLYRKGWKPRMFGPGWEIGQVEAFLYRADGRLEGGKFVPCPHFVWEFRIGDVVIVSGGVEFEKVARETRAEELKRELAELEGSAMSVGVRATLVS